MESNVSRFENSYKAELSAVRTEAQPIRDRVSNVDVSTAALTERINSQDTILASHV